MDIQTENNFYGVNNYLPAGDNANKLPMSEAPVKTNGAQKPEGAKECQTCANRRYQDSSGDPGVSFKAPTKLTPNQAASAVPAHEREHYSRESAKAKSEGREVVSNDIRIFTSICPECGRTYVSGGETRTVTRKIAENEKFAGAFYEDKIGKYLPKSFDERA